MERRYHLVLDAKQVALVTLAWVTLLDLARADAKNAAKMAMAFKALNTIDPKAVETLYEKLGKLLNVAIANEKDSQAADVLSELMRRRGKHGD